MEDTFTPKGHQCPALQRTVVPHSTGTNLFLFCIYPLFLLLLFLYLPFAPPLLLRPVTVTCLLCVRCSCVVARSAGHPPIAKDVQAVAVHEDASEGVLPFGTF